VDNLGNGGRVTRRNRKRKEVIRKLDRHNLETAQRSKGDNTRRRRRRRREV